MSGARILVVEDERIVAEDIKERLQSMGYTVTSVARSGKMAIKMVEENIPDLVLMDIVLKDKMDGIETAQQIRSRFNIPVVYLTAYSDEKTLKRAKTTEPFGYVIKPFREKELQINIEMALYKHKIEKELIESKEWFFTTLNSIGDAVISVDINGNVVFMNPTAQLLTGWNLEDGREFKLNEIYNIVNRETNEQIATHIKNSTEEIITFNKVVEKELIDKYGIHLPVEDKYKPIKDHNGNNIGHVLVFHDILDQKRIENTLKEALKNWQDIFYAISDGVFILDQKGRILNSNGVFESMMGIKTENIIFKHCYNIMHPSSDFIKDDPFEQMKQNRMRKSFEFKDKGRGLKFQVTMDPIYSDSGEIIKAILIIRNVTPSTKSEKKHDANIQLQPSPKIV
jgi:PAS domain S-box-containing protein